MKKALFISSKRIYPIICGGQIRTEQQLEFLSKIYDVDVVFISELKNPEIEPYYCFAKKVTYFYRPGFKCVLGTLRFLFNKFPLQVNYFYDKQMKAYIDKVANDYDLIFCNNIRTTEFVRDLKNKKIVDFVDAISMNYEKAKNHSSGVKKIIYNIDFHRCKSYEKKILEEFNSYSIISEIDKQYIESNA